MVYEFNDLSTCRSIPKDSDNRTGGEGDLVLRDKNNRVCALYAGSEPDTWERLASSPEYHVDVLRYDPIKQILR